MFATYRVIALLVMGLTCVAWANSGLGLTRGQDRWDPFGTQPMGGVFMNPAQLGLGYVDASVRLDTATDYLGYTQFAIGSIFRVRPVTFGIGYGLMSANDFVRTGRNAVTDRVEDVGGFADAAHHVTLGVATALDNGVVIGANLDYRARMIDTTSGSQWSAGFGALVPLSRSLYGVGYWRTLVEGPIKWSTGQTEFTTSTPVWGLLYRPAQGSVGLELYGDRVRVYGEWFWVRELSVHGEYVSGVSRYAVGTSLHLGTVSLTYAHAEYGDTDLSVAQDMIGIMVKVDDGFK